MRPGSDATIWVAVGWLLLLLLAWFALPRRLPEAARWPRAHPALTVALAAALARLVPTFALDRGLFYDVDAHWFIGSIVLSGRNVYVAPLAQGRYPYPPLLHEYLSALLVWLARGDRAAFLALDKLAPDLCGVGVAVVVWAMARRLGRGDTVALSAGLLYALNPVPVLVTAYHGQFEEIPLLFIGLAALLLVGLPAARHPRAGTVILSGLLLGIGIAYKIWPVLFLPPLALLASGWGAKGTSGAPGRVGAGVRRVETWALYGACCLVPLGMTLGGYGLLFGREGVRQAIKGVTGYVGANNFCWGYVGVLRSCWAHPAWSRPNQWVLGLNKELLVAGLLLAGALLLVRRRPLEGLVTLPLVFLLFSPGWGPDYSVWVLPVALAIYPAVGRWYTALVLPVVAVTYLDSLYASYAHVDFSWSVLKPIEAGLGLLGWVGVVALLAGVYVLPSRAGAAEILDDSVVERDTPIGVSGGHPRGVDYGRSLREGSALSSE